MIIGPDAGGLEEKKDRRPLPALPAPNANTASISLAVLPQTQNTPLLAKGLRRSTQFASRTLRDR